MRKSVIKLEISANERNLFLSVKSVFITSLYHSYKPKNMFSARFRSYPIQEKNQLKLENPPSINLA
jgi:hypothetical protein